LADTRTAASIGRAGHVAIQSHVERADAPVRLFDIGHERRVPCATLVAVAGQRGQEPLDFGMQRGFVDRRHAPVFHDQPAIDDHVRDRATGLGEHELSHRVVKRQKRRRAQIEQHDIGLATDRDPPDLLAQADRTCATQRGGSERPFTALASEQRKHLHRLEHVLRIGAARVVGAQRHFHAGIEIGAHRCHPAPGLEVGERIERDMRPRPRNLLDLGAT
jgi:hypothetical protein